MGIETTDIHYVKVYLLETWCSAHKVAVKKLIVCIHDNN